MLDCMRIRVLLFGQLKEIFGHSEDRVDLEPGSSVSAILDHYSAKSDTFRPLVSSIACSVNQEYAPASTVLQDGDEVGLLPPVSGGAGESGNNSDKKAQGLRSEHCAIVREPIDTRSIRLSLEHPEDGAITIFEGIVRNHSRGRKTLYLDYEAYEGMALNEMEKLSQAALQDFKVRDVRVVHRLGRLEIGETSILIMVSSAHRAAAFDACRWLIDTLKKTVPVWKKEYFDDGAVWADGEPFPEEVKAQK